MKIYHKTTGTLLFEGEKHQLFRANLYRADLSGSDLAGADLPRADLSWANLTGADLSRANLFEANLYRADLSGADLSRAYLIGANLSWANLSGVKGLLSVSEWVETCQSDTDGLIVYRPSKGLYDKPTNWKLEPGVMLQEVCNWNRQDVCGCGVNFANTIQWCQDNCPDQAVWRCRIAWKDVAGICAPLNTNGNARCERLTLIEQVK